MDIGDFKGKTAASSGVDIDLAEDVTLPGPAGEASDVNLEPTESAGFTEDESAGVLALDDDDELLDLSDSILLSEKNVGGAGNRPPSTIIGKAELDPDGDLDLTLSGDSKSTDTSDVKLATTTSDVLGIADDDSLDLESPSLSDNFQGLAEVDVDLEAESSRIHAAESGKGKKGAAQAQAAPSSGDLELAASSSAAGKPAQEDADIGLSGSDLGSGLAGLSALELAGDSGVDDDVLGEGSDITLSSGSSGINIISPSDSGLALDEVALSSASISSPLDLGDDAMLEPLELSDDAIEGDEPFQLTPIGEADDEEKDSSQIIALDDIAEEETAGVVFEADESDSSGLGGDFSTAGLVPGMANVATTVADEVAMSGWVFGLLSCGVLLLMMCGMMMFDLVRNIWSWDGVTRLNSTLLEVVNPLL
jgi:hypothetical protein